MGERREKKKERGGTLRVRRRVLSFEMVTKWLRFEKKKKETKEEKKERKKKKGMFYSWNSIRLSFSFFVFFFFFFFDYFFFFLFSFLFSFSFFFPHSQSVW